MLIHVLTCMTCPHQYPLLVFVLHCAFPCNTQIQFIAELACNTVFIVESAPIMETGTTLYLQGLHSWVADAAVQNISRPIHCVFVAPDVGPVQPLVSDVLHTNWWECNTQGRQQHATCLKTSALPISGAHLSAYICVLHFHAALLSVPDRNCR